MTTLAPYDLGEGIDLREAEVTDVEINNLTSSGTLSGNQVLNYLLWTAPFDTEVLALLLKVEMYYGHADEGNPLALAGKRPVGQNFILTTRDTIPASFGGVSYRDGDYFIESMVAPQWHTFEDETNGTGGESMGGISTLQTIIDPGKDATDAPLIFEENDTIALHLEQFGAVAANDELFTRGRLQVYHEEIDLGESDVRRQFPSGDVETIGG